MKNKILELRNQGKSYNEISKILNCSKGSISYHCGEGQKEKAKLRVIKSRKNKVNILNRKIEVFIRNNIRSFKRRGNGNLLTDSSLIYKETFKKITDSPICYLTGRLLDLENSNDYQLDHIIPRSKGGNNELNNMGLTCKDANQSKTNLTLEEYLNLCKEVLEHNGYKVIKK